MEDINTEKCETPAFFDVMGMNELLARPRPGLRPLFGDMWLSGELSVMFAEAGCGKSVLAVLRRFPYLW